MSFCSTHDNAFANSNPLALTPEPSMRVEFTVAVTRNFGLPIPQLFAHVWATVRTEGRSQVRVDQVGNGVASAPSAKGGYVTVAQFDPTWFNEASCNLGTSSTVMVKGYNPFNRRLGTVSKWGLRRCCWRRLWNLCEGENTGCSYHDSERQSAKVSVRRRKTSSWPWFEAPWLYVYTEIKVWWQARAQGRQISGLGCQSFCKSSDDIMVLCDFLGLVCALRTISSCRSLNITLPKHALAINRHILLFFV